MIDVFIKMPQGCCGDVLTDDSMTWPSPLLVDLTSSSLLVSSGLYLIQMNEQFGLSPREWIYSKSRFMT